MFAFDLDGRKMVSVALTRATQLALAQRAASHETSLQFELRKVLDGYPINGYPINGQQPKPDFEGTLVHRFVPVKKDIVEFAERVAATLHRNPGEVLGAIVTQELEKAP